MPPVIGRLAPSPTGHMHLGHARTFLLAYWSVRKKNGRLLLRLEDLDGERSTQRYIDDVLRDLEWLGIDWDGSPRLQSSGLSLIRERALSLYRRCDAFPCTCTKADIRAALSAPQEGASELRYSGRCRGRYATLEDAEAAPGKGAALRFVVSDGLVTVEDQFLGQRSFDVATECGDFLILRRDQIPAYQLAVVVDDAEDGVTEVVRGDDLLPSAARQQLLQHKLDYQTPTWFHVPLVVDETGRRLAKRTDDLSILSLREQGIDPRAIVGWAAGHSGWPNMGRATARELVPGFDWNVVPRDRLVVTSTLEHELKKWA